MTVCYDLILFQYLSTMEKKLQDSVDENRRLREQNERLKKCVQSLQSEVRVIVFFRGYMNKITADPL